MKKSIFLFVVIAFALFSSFVFYLDYGKNCSSVPCITHYISTGEVSSQESELADSFISKIIYPFVNPVGKGRVLLQPVDPPNAPSLLTATPLTSSEIRLNWQDNSDNEDGFILEYKLTQELVWTTVNLPPNTNSYNHQGLISFTSYDYRVLAYNAVGSSAYDGPITAQTFLVPSINSLSPNVLYSNGSDIQMTIDGLNFVTPFEILVRFEGGSWTPWCVGGFGNCNFVNQNTLTFFLYRPFIAGNYEIMYVNVGGSAPDFSNPISLTIIRTAPAAPSGLNAVTLSESEIRLDWTDNSHNEDGSTLERKLSSGSTFAVVPGAGQLPPNTQTFTDTGLTPETSYDYRVLAFNNLGNSPYSNVTTNTTEQTLQLSDIQPVTFSFVNPVTITLIGQFFANNADVLIDNTPVAVARIVSRSAGQIVFQYQPNDYRVGAHIVNVSNPTSGRTSNGLPFRITANPSIARLNPNIILNNQENLVAIEGQEFDPDASILFNGVDVTAFSIKINSGLINLTVPANVFPGGDYNITVRSGDGSVTSNLANLRINYPFDYNLLVNGSIFNLNASESFQTFAVIQTLLYMFQESVTVTSQAPPGINIVFSGPSSCTPDVSLPIPNCGVNFSIITSNTSFGEYTVVFNATSSNTLREHQTNITVNVTNVSRLVCGDGFCSASIGETCSTCPSDCSCGGTPGSGGSGGGGGGGGGAPKKVLQQCEDKKDNDGDGKIDYPLDKGCSSLTDSSEVDISELVESNYTLGGEGGDEIEPQEEGNKIRIVFWIVAIFLIAGILVISVVIVRSLMMHGKFEFLSNIASKFRSLTSRRKFEELSKMASTINTSKV